MTSCKKGKFPYCIFILLTQWHKFPQKLRICYVYVNLLPLNVTLFSKDLYLTAHIKINYEVGCIGRLFEKIERYFQDHRDS